MEHYHIFDRMKANKPVRMTDTKVFDGTKKVFAKIREEGGGMEGLPVREVTLYRKAQEMEKEPENFYREKAEELKGKPQEAVFLGVADEEKGHCGPPENDRATRTRGL